MGRFVPTVLPALRLLYAGCTKNGPLAQSRGGLPMHKLIPAILLAGACESPSDDESRKHVTGVLTQTLGEAARPRVAFQRDSTHLLVQLLTVAFPSVSEDELTAQATDIAQTTLNNYDRADQLDSITVLYRERAGRGVWWIRHTRAFSVDSLNGGLVPIAAPVSKSAEPTPQPPSGSGGLPRLDR